mgnify:CR=1 FL=1
MFNPLLERVTPIRYQLGQRTYRATGFFYRYGGEHYLITNKHVVEHEHDISPKSLRIQVKFKVGDKIDTRPVRVELFDDDGNERWLTHSKNPNVDLAAVPIAIDLTKTPTHFFSSKQHVPQDTNMTIAGSGVLTVGIPGPIAPGESNTAIVRSGVASSVYGEPFGGEPCFLVDSNLHDGMSGSPIVLQTNSMYNDSDETYFRLVDFLFIYWVFILVRSIKSMNTACIVPGTQICYMT